jgi:hypothetical protein
MLVYFATPHLLRRYMSAVLEYITSCNTHYTPLLMSSCKHVSSLIIICTEHNKSYINPSIKFINGIDQISGDDTNRLVFFIKQVIEFGSKHANDLT